jgi:tetratricopeptide (TPR) repeat protein
MSTTSRGALLALGMALSAAAPLPAQRIKLPLSLDELERRAHADSNDAAAHYNVALAYWNEKRFDDAEKSLKLAVSLEPRFAPAHLALAYLPFARRPKLWDEIFENRVPKELTADLDQSDREYRHAFLIDPMVDLRIMAAVTPGKADFLDVQNYLGEAYALFFQGFTDCQEGRYEDCHGRFTALIRTINGERFADRIPNSVLWYKGIAAGHLGKYDIAAQHFRTLMGRDLDFEKELEAKGEFSRVPLRTNEYRYTLATILQAAGKEVDAISLYREALAADIGLYMAHVQLAGIYEAEKDFPRAVQERMDAVNANPDDPSLLLDLGVTLGKAGMMPQAETRLQMAADANPRDPRSFFWLGIAQMSQGKKPEAKASFTHFLELAPSRFDRQIAMAKDRLAQLQ